MLLKNKEIEKIAEDLYFIQAKFIQNIEEDKSRIKDLLNIFKSFFELSLWLAVNYNDNIWYDYLTSSRKTKFNFSDFVGEFVHCKCDTGENLWKIIIRNSLIIKQHFKKGKKQIKLTNKIITNYEAEIQLFTIVDNFYYAQLTDITEDELDNFYEQLNKVDNSHEKFKDILKCQDKLTYEEDSGKEQWLNFNKARVIPLTQNDTILQTKMSIEIFINTYFTESFNKSGEIYYSIIHEIENFSRKINKAIIAMSEGQGSNYPEKAEKFNNTTEKIQFDYIDKVASSLSRYFYNISKIPAESVDLLIDHFIFSNWDETIFKVLIIFSTGRYVNQTTAESLDLCLTFLSFFFMNKKGMRYFLIGKNITRMNKMFNRFRYRKTNRNISNEMNRSQQSNLRFSTRILEFVFLCCKGISVYNIGIKEHKVWLRFKDNLIEHLSLYYSENIWKIDQDMLFRVHVSLAMTIFWDWRHLFILEDLEYIKNVFWKIFIDSRLIYTAHSDFLAGFIKEKDDMGRIWGDDLKSKTSINHSTVLWLNSNIKKKIKKEQSSNLVDFDLCSHNSSDAFKKDDPFYTFMLSDADPTKQFEWNERLYSQFFRLMAFNTYYTYANDIDEKFKWIPSVNDLNTYKERMQSQNWSLPIRRSILNFLRSFIFAEYLDKDNIKQCETAWTTSEFIKYENGDTQYNSKYEKIQKQELLIGIYIQELSIFPKQIINYSESIEEAQKYIEDLIISLKIFANFFYNNKQIWIRSVFTFYSLVTEWASTAELIRDMYKSIVNECKFASFQRETYAQNEIYLRLRRRKFDITNKEWLYSMITKLWNSITTGTKAQHYSSLDHFLKKYDTLKDYNFSPPSFIDTNDFEYFYTENENEQEREDTPSSLKLETIIQTYTDQFVNIESTNFLEIISGIFDESDQVDYRREFIKYFISYIKGDNIAYTKLYPWLCIINKMWFYDTKGTQQDLKMLSKDKNRKFFDKYNIILHRMLVHTFTSCHCWAVPDLFLLYSNITKLWLQFLQLLGEGFNTDFHSIIFLIYSNKGSINTVKNSPILSPEPTPPNEKVFNNKTNHMNVNGNQGTWNNQNNILNAQTGQSNKQKSPTFPTLFNEPTSIVSSKETHRRKGKSKMEESEKMKWINNSNWNYWENSLIGVFDSNPSFYALCTYNLMNCYSYLNLQEQLPFEMPYDKLIVLSNNLIDVITGYIDVKEIYENIIIKNIEILFSQNVFKCLLLQSNVSNKLRSNLICFMKGKFLNLVIQYFQKGTQKESLKEQIRRFTKLLSPLQIFEEIWHHMQALFLFLKFPKILPLLPVNSFISKLQDEYIYNQEFRDSLQLNLCLQYFILIKFYEEVYQITTLKEHISKIKDWNDVQSNYYGINTKFAFKIRSFFEELVLKVDIKRVGEDKEETVNVETFFVRPYITYYLSEQTKESFELNVDRTSTSSKLNELLFYSDYFSFEMATNSRILGRSIWSWFIKGLLMKYIELFSYCMLIVHNVIMITINFKDTTLPIDEYNELILEDLYIFDTPNLILALIQTVFLLIVLALWFYYKFPWYFEKSILRKTGRKFIFKKVDNTEEKENMQIIKDYFDISRENIGVLSTISKLNKSISKMNLLYYAVVDAFWTNREVSILFYTLIFLILYLSTACIIWLAIPLLFLFNSIPTLYNVFSSVKEHLMPLLAIVMLIYIFSYNFMWISFHYMSDLFYFDVWDYENGIEIEEPMCSSSLQCLLHIIEYFVVGTAPDTDQVSFKNDMTFYVINFFYDFFFFIFVSWVMYNVFLGVLYDTFSELRGSLQSKENDIHNVCFICQLTRDGSLAKRIDFYEHVNFKHNMWNYVYFMIYWHISNPNDFDSIQQYVWEKLLNQENSWIPNSEE